MVLSRLPARADLVLEIETAELDKKGDSLVSTAVQFERERAGSTTTFTLNQYKASLTDRAELLIESFFREFDHPKGAASFSGTCDLEITPSYMLASKNAAHPQWCWPSNSRCQPPPTATSELAKPITCPT
ncbi:hypothetical protein [Abditibacterium utsteinense]|uniref:hypothetical protein n=1 Tax=Abditibacterium utsteinense TaxID=1960156 RepID=UPI001300529D|nr:hypothetical protein [Abditibacterium utsteinense]